MFGTLYIVATPIGNLEDVTLRAIRILSEVDIILAEDTRVAKKLLSSSNFKNQITNIKQNGKSQIPNSKLEKLHHTPQTSHHSQLISYHSHSPDKKKYEILRHLVEGKNIALVTDAGTPGISDPGNELLSFITEKEPNISVVPIPGPSAITTALSVCGMNVNRFVFAGFLPKKGLSKFLDQKFSADLPVAYFDSPHRLIKNLETIAEKIGPEVEVFVGRELTKMYETHYRGKILDVLKKLKESDPRGEVVVVLKLS